MLLSASTAPWCWRARCAERDRDADRERLVRWVFCDAILVTVGSVGCCDLSGLSCFSDNVDNLLFMRLMFLVVVRIPIVNEEWLGRIWCGSVWVEGRSTDWF
jgi:hypothetical protein